MESKIPLYKRKVVIAMASFPPRKNGMLTTIRQLISQCNHFYLWLNEYADIPLELKQFDSKKLTIKLAGKDLNLKENGRYTWINDEWDSYYLTVDDDINYPKDYAATLIRKIDQYKEQCIMSFHGTRFINNEEVYFPFLRKVPIDTQVHRVGGGVMGFVPSKINFKCPSIDELRTWDGDASISVWATLHGIKKYVIAHDKNYFSHQMDGTTQISLVEALFLNDMTKKKRESAYSKLKEWEKIQ